MGLSSTGILLSHLNLQYWQ